MVAILFLSSAFLFPPDSEFGEAPLALYSPEELGKSAPLAFSSPNSAREPRVWGEPWGGGERRGGGRSPGCTFPSRCELALVGAGLWGGGESVRCAVCVGGGGA